MADIEHDTWTQGLIDDLREHAGVATMAPMTGRKLLILTTTGRQSGEAREAVLAYARDGERYVIVGSKSGEPTHPGWYYNLLAHPDVHIEAGGEQFAARATVTEGAERTRLWDQHVAEMPAFAEYTTMTDRVLPVIALGRVPG
jgi:deazaflavin-dependent oxidoreductase (nitroreductase family)